MRVSRRELRWIVFAVTVAVGMAFAILLASYARAEEPEFGDCFNGVLSNDPLNCYLLEQAREHEVIDIDAIYEVPGILLYVYITPTDPDWDRIVSFLRREGEKFALRWPESAFQEAQWEYYEFCLFKEEGGASIQDCLMLSTSEYPSYYTEPWNTLSYRMPYSPLYGRILIKPGGSEAKRSQPAWPTFREVWPSSASGASGATGGFDVSDVDLTNFPDYRCRRLEWRLIERGETCEVAKAKTQATADRSGEYWNFAGDKRYVEFKNPPKDEQELEKLKEALIPPCRGMPVCTRMDDDVTGERTVIATAGSIRVGTPVQFHGPLANATSTLRIISEDLDHYHKEIKRLLAAAFPNDTSTKIVSGTSISRHWHKETGWEPEITIVPVAYNSIDLLKYEEILNRFVSSRGNTVGILSAEVGDNEGIDDDDVVFTPKGPGPARELPRPDGGTYPDPAALRTTVVVYALQPQRVVDALPRLLPALGIPLDVVGAVHKENYRIATGPGYRDDHPCLGSAIDCLNLTPPAFYRLLYDVLGVPGWVPMWVNISAAAAITLVVLGSVGFTASRMVVGTVRFARRRRQG